MIVASLGGIFRLHPVGSYGCWMGRKRDFRNATEFDTKPPTSRYTHVCKLCWPPKAGDNDSESGEASSAHTETARSLGTKLRGVGKGRVLGPQKLGQSNPRLPRYIRLTGLNLNQTLHDFIRTRM